MSSQDDPTSSPAAEPQNHQVDGSRFSFILHQGPLQRMFHEYKQKHDRHPAEPQNRQVDDIMVQALRKEVNDLYDQIKGLLDQPVVEEHKYHECFEKMKQSKSIIDQRLEDTGNFLKEMDMLRQGLEEQLEQHKIALAASKENELESISNLKKAQEEVKEVSLKLKKSNKELSMHKIKLSRQIEIKNEISNSISDSLLHKAMPTIMLSQRPKDVTDKVSVLVRDYKRIFEEVNKKNLELEQAKEGANELLLKLQESTKKLKEAECLITHQEKRLSRHIEIISLIKNALSHVTLPQETNYFTDKVNMLVVDYNRIKDALLHIKFPWEVISQDLCSKVNWLASDYKRNCDKLKLEQGKETKELLLKQQVSDNMPKDAKSSISHSISHRILHRDWVINQIKVAVSHIKFPREVIFKDLPTKVMWLARDYKRTCHNLDSSKLKLEYSLDDIDDTVFPHEEGKEPIEPLDKVKWLLDFYQKNKKFVASLSDKINIPEWMANEEETTADPESSSSATATHESNTENAGNGQSAPTVSQDGTTGNGQSAPTVSQDGTTGNELSAPAVRPNFFV